MKLEFINKALTILEPALLAGVNVTLSNTNINLNTGMKSECVLVECDDKIIAQCRYNKDFEINDFDDIIDAVRWCECHKGFGCYYWLEIIGMNK